MKNFYLLCMLCMFFTACSVEDEEPYLEESLVESLDGITVVINKEDPCNPVVQVNLCTSDISNPTLRGFSNFFDAQIQVHTGLPLTGTYSQSMAELLEQYQESGGIGTFSTTYTVATENCGEATAVVTAEVSNCQIQDPVTCAEDIAVELCAGDIKTPNAHGFRNYFDAQVQLHSDLPLNGTFNPSMEELVAQYQQGGGIGTFVSNYTVYSEACGEVTIEVSCTVNDCEVQEPINCAEDIMVQICPDDITDVSANGFESYFNAQIQLHSDLPLDGTFSPSMAELVAEFQQGDGTGTYTTNYTVYTEDCGEVTIAVSAEVSECD